MNDSRAPKNPDPMTKPRIKAWYEENPNCKAHVERLISELSRFFVDKSDHGYLNMKNQNVYRFGGSYAVFGNAVIYFNKTYSTVQFWLNSARQKMFVSQGGLRRTLKSAKSTDLYAVQFKVNHGENLDAITEYLEKNVIPRWIQEPTLSFVPPISFDEAVAKAKKLTRKQRIEKLKQFPKFPVKVEVTTSSYVRNPFVVAEVLLKSRGICKKCGENAPFKRKDGTPYLEVHHKTQLARGGEDTVANAIALCPNCHREKHYG
jgi:HNH endonuclease